jgi:hypothetical protein
MLGRNGDTRVMGAEPPCFEAGGRFFRLSRPGFAKFPDKENAVRSWLLPPLVISLMILAATVLTRVHA